MKKYLFGGLMMVFPALAFAQLGNIKNLVTQATDILNSLVPFAIGLGLVVFLFGVVRYITAGAGEEKAAARNLMIYGIIALFVMVSVWGLVHFIQRALNVGNEQQTAPAPGVPTPANRGGSGFNF